jgi:hypothetical protein
VQPKKGTPRRTASFLILGKCAADSRMAKAEMLELELEPDARRPVSLMDQLCGRAGPDCLVRLVRWPIALLFPCVVCSVA